MTTPTNSANEVLPAVPGSYGVPPAGFRLPNETRLGAVHLQVANAERSVRYYQQVLGLEVHKRDDERIWLSAADNEVLVVLHEQTGAAPALQRGRLGLYHFAILLPTRADLGRFVKHLAALNLQAGAGDHIVSEAFYLNDPDGHGIEVYADRPRESWQRIGRELVMATDPVDVQDLVRSAGDSEWTGMPAGTVMGHVHLHVGNLEEAGKFYSDAIGFDRMVMRYPGALFMAAGGYHHHLGTNIWAGAGAQPSADNDARLIEWTVVLPNTTSLEQLEQSLHQHGYETERDDDGLVTRDPWNTQLRVVVEGK